MSRTVTTLIAIAVLLTACGQPEVLLPRDNSIPAGIDLSGKWQIRADMEDDQKKLRDAIRRTSGARSGSGSRNSKPRKVQGGVVHVFLETGESLKITQTVHGLFISFDRSIVEEYRFGEQRVISIGEVQAQRVTGWEGEQLVVETLDKHGVKLTDRFELTNSGQSLRREITLRSKKYEEQTVIQEFDRIE